MKDHPTIIYEHAEICPGCKFISISWGLSRSCPYCGLREKLKIEPVEYVGHGAGAKYA